MIGKSKFKMFLACLIIALFASAIGALFALDLEQENKDLLSVLASSLGAALTMVVKDYFTDDK